MSRIKELRTEKNYTQQQVAEWLGMSLRSYKTYENDKSKEGSLKYNYILEKLSKANSIDEEHGIVNVDYIREKCSAVFKEYPVHYCILFGSYAKQNAKGESDVDLLVSSDLKGLEFFGMVERLRQSLKKRVDVLNTEQLLDNFELTNEILRYGIRIYVES